MDRKNARFDAQAGEERHSDVSDEQLITLYRDGDKEAIDTLLARYKDMVRIKARSMYIIGGDNDDLIQEGMIGLLKAVRDYDFGRDTLFHTFAELCVSRQMYTTLQAYGRKKHMPLNNYVSLNQEKDESGRMGKGEVAELLMASDQFDPESLLIDRENVERIHEIIEKELSPFEKQVLDLRLTGMNYTQIAGVLGRDAKSTDNALSRIKNKLREKLL